MAKNQKDEYVWVPATELAAKSIGAPDSSLGSLICLSNLKNLGIELNLEYLLGLFKNESRISSISIVPKNSGNDGTALQVNGPVLGLTFVNSNHFDLLGTLDTNTEDQASELLKWCSTATAHGLRHIVLPLEGVELTYSEEFVDIDKLESDFSSTPAYKLAGVKPPFSLIVDGSWLGEYETGAQTVIVNFLRNLARHNAVRRIAICNVPKGLPSYALDLQDLDIEIFSSLPNADFDIFWRPSQPDATFQVTAARNISRRIVVTYFDLIAFENRTYHSNFQSWINYRKLQRMTAEQCDLVVAISEDVRKSVLDQFLRVSDKRVATVGIGVDHIQNTQQITDSNVRTEIQEISKKRFLFFLGTQYTHKNFEFARKVALELIADGYVEILVVGGLELNDSHLLHDNPNKVAYFGPLTTGERNLLLSAASLVLYPTSAEGFGLVPFEAASVGTPTVYTKFGFLKSVLPDSKMPTTWSISEYKEASIQLLESQAAVSNQAVALNRIADENFTWLKVTDDLVAAFEKTLASPSVIVDRSIIEIYENSLSWKVTAPIRYVLQSMKALQNKKKRIVTPFD